jgi:thioredoxin-like negative regulator of GroEL
MAKIELDENPQGAAVDGIRFFYAKAFVAYAATLTKKGEKDKLLKQATKIYKGLTKSKNNTEWKAKATESLIAMGAIKTQEEKPQAEPKNFDEAFSAAAAAMRQRRKEKTGRGPDGSK